MTLHVSACCQVSGKRKQSGQVLSNDCNVDNNGGSGCGVRGSADSFGAGLNANGGGTYAMEWRKAGIRIWFFGRGNLPADLPSDPGNMSVSPDPSTWGTAVADFPSTYRDVAAHFENQSVIANIDLCGDWAGETSVYNFKDQCPGSCKERVAGADSNFDTAYWEFRSSRVYAAS